MIKRKLREGKSTHGGLEGSEHENVKKTKKERGCVHCLDLDPCHCHYRGPWTSTVTVTVTVHVVFCRCCHDALETAT